jgi:hypothetical protein
MISLHVYLIPKKGRELEFDSAVRDGWIPAMSEQPGFLAAAVVRPYELTELEASGQRLPLRLCAATIDTIGVWRSW